jgi:hypothetical protein
MPVPSGPQNPPSPFDGPARERRLVQPLDRARVAERAGLGLLA